MATVGKWQVSRTLNGLKCHSCLERIERGGGRKEIKEEVGFLSCLCVFLNSLVELGERLGEYLKCCQENGGGMANEARALS